MADQEASTKSSRSGLSNLSVSDNGSQSNETDFMHLDVGERMGIIFSDPHKLVPFILGVVAISLNILAVLAILKIRGPLTSHYRFILSLAMSDILIGISVTLHVISIAVSPTYYPGYGPEKERLTSRCIYVVIKALNTTALNSTLLNLMGMAIDHFLAIVKPLHYPTLMNKQRASIIISIFWCIAILCGFSDFMSGYPKFPRFARRYNYCEFIHLTKYQDEYPMFAIALLCATVMTVTYVNILTVISRRHHGMGFHQDSAVRNKKAVITTLLILGTFVFCWLPMCLFQLIMIIQVKVDPEPIKRWWPILSKADMYLFDLLMLNAICDPIIYAVRTREIRSAYHRLFHQKCLRRKHYNNGEATNTSFLLHDNASKSGMNSIKSSIKMAEYPPSLKQKITFNAGLQYGESVAV